MIRKFQSKDIDQIMEIWLNSNISAHEFIDSSYWKRNYESVKEMIPQATIYVCEENEEIQAFVGLMNNCIAGIFVSEEFQSKGIGTRLLNYCKGIHSNLILHVYHKNKRAIQFYLREDFIIHNEKIDENTGEMEYEMEWNTNKKYNKVS